MENQIHEAQQKLIGQDKLILAVVLSIVLTALVVGGGMYIWYVQALVQPLTVLPTSYSTPPEAPEIPDYTPAGPRIPGYKAVTESYFSFEVPSAWNVTSISEFIGEDTLPQFPSLSVAQDIVRYGDLNWSQVDFYLVQNDIVERLVAQARTDYPTIEFRTETVGGLSAQVATLPLDDTGQVSKGGTGGKIYYIRLPGTGPYDPRTVYIFKQALGDAEFEAGFNHLIETLVIK